jgi:hypothetical protein
MMTQLLRSRWVPVAFMAVYGAGLFAASWARGMHGKAIQTAVFVAVLAGGFVVLAARSTWFRQHVVDPDERIGLFDVTAGKWAGLVLFLALLAGFLVEWGRGDDGDPYYWLALVYVGAYFAVAVAQGLRR